MDILNLLYQPKNGTISINTHDIFYRVQNYEKMSNMSLVDRGSNGGITGDDVRII